MLVFPISIDFRYLKGLKSSLFKNGELHSSFGTETAEEDKYDNLDKGGQKLKSMSSCLFSIIDSSAL